MTPLNLFLGLLLSVIIAALAYWRGSLSSSGVVGAIIVGTLIFAIGGLVWAVLLITFFATSSALSHYQERAKEPLAEKFQKGHRRDIGQVLANGGWGALLALAFAFAPQPILFVAFVGAMAAVNADTWATELGVLSQRAPRLITNGKIVAMGTSGGVTPLGTFAAFCSALLIGVLAFIVPAILDWFFPDLQSAIPQGRFAVRNSLFLLPIAAFAGLLGSLFDSLLGATVQGIYYCDFDQKETESALHRCGRATRLIRGWRWLDNDCVNLLASVVGSGIAAGMYSVVG